MVKPFNKLTQTEAETLAKTCVQGARSEGEIRQNLTEAGFDGDSAAITSRHSGSTFQAIVMVNGPSGEFITA